MPVTRSVSIEELASMFCLPEKICARQLGVCLTSLKKICRSHGISRWPYRKLKSIDKKLGKIENALTNSASSTEDPAAMKYKLEMLKLEKRNLPFTATNGALGAPCALPASFMASNSSAFRNPRKNIRSAAAASGSSAHHAGENGEYPRKRTSPVANTGAASSASSSPSSPLSSSSSSSHHHTAQKKSSSSSSTASGALTPSADLDASAFYTSAAGHKRSRMDGPHHGLPAPANKMIRKDQSPSASSSCSTASTATLPHPGVVVRSLSSSSLSSSISHHQARRREDEDDDEEEEEEDDVSMDSDNDDDEDYEMVSASRARRAHLNMHHHHQHRTNTHHTAASSADAASSSANSSSAAVTSADDNNNNASTAADEGVRPPTPRCEPPRAARHYRPSELELCESLALPLPSETCGGRPVIAAGLNTDDDALLMSAPPRNRREDASLLADYYCRPDSARFLSARGAGAQLLEGLPLISPSNATGNGRETVMDELFPLYTEPLSTASKADFFTSEEPDFFLLH